MVLVLVVGRVWSLSWSCVIVIVVVVRASSLCLHDPIVVVVVVIVCAHTHVPPLPACGGSCGGGGAWHSWTPCRCVDVLVGCVKVGVTSYAGIMLQAH